MKPLHFGLFLIVPVASFFLGHQISQNQNQVQSVESLDETPKCESSAVACAEFEKFKSRMEGVTPEEIRDYLNTQNADEKLRKADEILGKIMQALVANVGFRLPKEELEKFGKPILPIDTQPVAAPLPMAVRAFEKTEAPAASGGRLIVDVANVQTEDEAKKILEGLSKDFSSRLQQSGILTADQIRELTGNFEGTIFFTKDPRPVRATMSFRGRLEDKKLRGTANVKIYSLDGRVTSDSSSRGDLGRDFSAKENSIFVEVGNRYLELIYFTVLDQWMGSVLEMQKGSFTKTGDVVLRRR